MSSKPLSDDGMEMTLPSVTELREIARRFDFCACGVTELRAVDKETAERYHRWVEDGRNAEMGYLANFEDKRFDPRELMPEAKTMICLAMSYAPDPDRHLSADGYKFAAYALGKDYHDVMKAHLRDLAEALGLKTYRVFTDTAPILERYWAQQTGIGWIGRNRQLIVPHHGSMVFLGEILTDAVASETTEPLKRGCGMCRRCMEACPTHALGEVFDARLCLSYQTIENRNDIPQQIVCKMDECIYGCDKCLMACPHNHNVVPTTVEEFMPSEALRAMTKEDWRQMTVEQYRSLFKGSAVKRAKYEGLKRNIDCVEAGTICSQVKEVGFEHAENSSNQVKEEQKEQER